MLSVLLTIALVCNDAVLDVDFHLPRPAAPPGFASANDAERSGHVPAAARRWVPHDWLWARPRRLLLARLLLVAFARLVL